MILKIEYTNDLNKSKTAMVSGDSYLKATMTIMEIENTNHKKYVLPND